MAELKTKANDDSVVNFLNSVDEDQKRKDSFELLEFFKHVTEEEPKMWGDSIIGFGQYHYRYDSGREGDWLLTGFSPRKQALTIYLMCDLSSNQKQLERLGKFKMGKSCLYIKKFDDIDRNVLSVLIKESITFLKEKYGE